VNAVAIGVGQTATGSGAVAIGDPNTATGTGAVAIGADNTATGDGAVAIGNLSQALSDGAVAIGNSAIADGTNGVAIGNGASNAAFANSVAIGNGSVNTADNQVHVGGRTIAGVAAGALNLTSTDAVNGSQLFATNQVVAGHTSQIATNTAAIATLGTAITGMQADIGTLFDLRKEDRRDMKQGIASAVAIANAPMPSNPGGVSYALNGATFRGEYAVGGSLNFRLNTEKPMALGVGFSYAGNKNNSARVGVSGEF
jgi:autotransporter adhesin